APPTCACCREAAPRASPSASSAACRSDFRPLTCTRSAPAEARSSAATQAARSGSARKAPARIRGLRATARAAARPSPTRTCSALGLVASDERRDQVVSHVRPLAEVGELPVDGEADLRYRGQSFELTVTLQLELARAFHRAHEERYGYADESREIELVAVRTAEVVPGPELSFAAAARHRVAGPALVELPGATCWIPRGWHGETNDAGTLVL